MDELDLAWAAGFIDGEGSIQITKTARKHLVNPQVYLSLTANQIEERPLRKLQELFGGSLYLRPKRDRRAYMQRPIWVWSVFGLGAYNAIKAIRPWLLVKGERADLAVEFHESCYLGEAWHGARETKPSGGAGALKPEVFKTRMKFFDAMRTLNLRGAAAMQQASEIIEGAVASSGTA